MKKLVRAVFTLSVFTLLERIIGFFFKVYLSRKLGAEALGVYQVSFSFFLMLLTLTTSGLPLIVSKMTAKCRAQNELCVEGAISTASLIISIVLSLLVCAFVLLFNRQIGMLFASDSSRILLLMMLPALLFSGIYSSFRGNLWGRQKYTMVSLLELSEQIARIGACVILFSVGFDRLNVVGISLSIGCFVAAAICVICYFATGARLNNPRGRIMPLLKSSMPVTAARAATSLSGMLTAIVAPFLLVGSGLTSSEAMYEYGYSMGMALPLLFIPLTIVGSLAFAMIPSLSEAVATGNKQSAKRQIDGAIKMSLVVGALFFPAFFVLGRPMGALVYNNADAGAFLRTTAWLLLPISVESITSSMMNSLDMELRGLAHYIISAGLMFGAFFASGKHFSVEFMSIIMGLCWILSSVLNIIAMRKKAGISFGFVGSLLLCAILAVPTVFLTQWLYNILAFVPSFFRIALAGGIGFLFMAALSFLFGVIKIDAFKSGENEKSAQKPKSKSTIGNPSPQTNLAVNTNTSTQNNLTTRSDPSAKSVAKLSTK